MDMQIDQCPSLRRLLLTLLKKFVKPAKMPCFSYYVLCSFSTKLENRRMEEVLWKEG
jgi:hypothetical protein